MYDQNMCSLSPFSCMFVYLLTYFRQSFANFFQLSLGLIFLMLQHLHDQTRELFMKIHVTGCQWLCWFTLKLRWKKVFFSKICFQKVGVSYILMKIDNNCIISALICSKIFKWRVTLFMKYQKKNYIFYASFQIRLIITWINLQLYYISKIKLLLLYSFNYINFNSLCSFSTWKSLLKCYISKYVKQNFGY